MKFYAVDSIMGSGKTSAAINMINSAPEDRRFIYMTPFLAEAERINQSCPNCRFIEPSNDDGTKLADLKKAVDRRRNISTTHSLFTYFDHTTVQKIREQHYTLIIDEAPPVVQVDSKINYYDTMILTSSLTKTDPVTGKMSWSFAPDYRGGVFDQYKESCDKGYLYFIGNSLIKVMPPENFNCFDEVYILTYMFEAQTIRGYCEIQHIDYTMLGVAGDSYDTYHFVPYGEAPAADTTRFQPLIRMWDDKNRNTIDSARTALSYSWYGRSENAEKIHRLYNAIHHFFRRQTCAPSERTLWTTFATYKEMLEGRGYKTGFISCNARSMNDYAGRDAVAYMINRFLHPSLSQFFAKRGVQFDQNAFATSEMLQWIFRSAIRNDQPITLYMPSRRMRDLLAQWLKLPGGCFPFDSDQLGGRPTMDAVQEMRSRKKKGGESA